MSSAERRWQGTSRGVATAIMLLACAAAAADTHFKPIGTALDAAVALPETVHANGDGLPSGRGSVRDGAALYAQRCAGCHGGRGEGGSAIELVGDRSLLDSEYPDRGVAVYWPYAPPLYDYVRRAMPPDAPYSLGVDETYAVVAFVLHLNALLDDTAVLDAASLSAMVMPNRDGFLPGHSALGLEPY